MARGNLQWMFPPNHGGKDDGFNDSGLAHFSGAKFASLVREIIQNSLDAREMPLGEAVRVVFEVKEIPSDDFPGRAELRKIFKLCVKESRNAKDDKAQKFFKRGLAVIEAHKIRLLRMSDYNTTGLSSSSGVDTWHNLIKGSGISGKSSDAGGSWGIGKNASYVLSELRTVFYSTMYKDKKGAAVRKAQGRSVLMSHGDGEDRTVGTGFYGENGMSPIVGGDIPDFLARKDQGTTVCVAGFREVKKWMDYITAAVVSSFYVAIRDKNLIVQVGDSTHINAETLTDDFDMLLQNYGEDDEFYADVKLGRQMYEALTRGDERDMQLRGLGHCKLRILAGDNLPQQVGIVRNTGMMITAAAKRLQRFPGIGEFVAVCICDDPKGNQLLRRMENPQHDAFQTDHLEDEKEKGEKALKEMAREIRKRIKEIVASTEQDTVLAEETLKYFSDTEGDDGGNEEGPDRDFERGIVITRKKRKAPVIRMPHLPPDPDHVPAPGPGPKPPHPRPRQMVDVRNIRVVDGESERERAVYFTPAESAKADLEFWIVGDESSERLELDGESGKRARNFDLVANARVKFSITTAETVRGALRVVALKEKSEEGEKK
ncbi:MAG: hypothetical protein ACR2QC_03165 [Gammaproteobacteria bacterium]